jgi:hypothetical protein
MCINNIVNVGFIEDKHFELFKRKRWILCYCKCYAFYTLAITKEEVYKSKSNKLVHLTVSTDTSSVDTIMRILYRKNKQQNIQSST